MSRREEERGMGIEGEGPASPLIPHPSRRSAAEERGSGVGGRGSGRTFVPRPPTADPRPPTPLGRPGTAPEASEFPPLPPETPAGSARPRLFNFLKWLYPGMRVKRWFFLVILCAFVVTVGVDILLLPRWLDLLDAFIHFFYDQF